MFDTERLKEIRKELKLSQEEFSKRLGVTRRVYSYIENKKSTLSGDSLIRLMREFQINPYYLYTRSNLKFIPKNLVQMLTNEKFSIKNLSINGDNNTVGKDQQIQLYRAEKEKLTEEWERRLRDKEEIIKSQEKTIQLLEDMLKFLKK